MANITSTLLIIQGCDNHEYFSCHLAQWLWRLVPGTLLVLGTCGNILSIAVLSRKNLRKYSTAVYLLLMSVSDLIVLWTNLLRKMLLWITSRDINDMSDVLCVGQQFVAYTAGGMSVWLLVLLTIERMLYTKYPLVAKARLTPRTAFISSLIVLVVVSLVTGHLLFGFRRVPVQVTSVLEDGNTTISNDYLCEHTSDSYARFYRMAWILTLITCFVVGPFILIVIGNSTIAATLLMQRRKVRPIAPGTSNQHARLQHASKMLFTLSAFFIITLVPYCVSLLVYNALAKQLSESRIAGMKLAHVISLIFFWCNYTFNFFLYFVSGSLFKREWRVMVRELDRAFRNNWYNVKQAFTGHRKTKKAATRQSKHAVAMISFNSQK